MRTSSSLAAAVGAIIASASPVMADVLTGPSSSQTPYVTPIADDWSVTSLLTVGDSASDSVYPMVGIPDGLGAFRGRIGTKGEIVRDANYMTVLMNHELGGTSGAVRTHGQKGAFISQWTINVNSLQVEQGQDLIQRVYTWSGSAWADTTGSTAFNRFCSADFPGVDAFYNERSRKGYRGAIFMNGEEAGAEGRAFAHVVSGGERGISYELPSLGRFSWENSVTNRYTGDKTLVIGTDDSTPGQVYLYVGDKQASGNAVERAGLHGGKLFGIKVNNGGSNYANGAVALEKSGAINGSFELVDVSAVAAGSGAVLQSTSVSLGVTEFARPEDSAWDTRHPRSLYFVTTGATVGGAVQTSRLYRLTLNSLNNPTGGTIELVLDSSSLTGSDGQTARSFDNLTVNDDGKVLVQEDPGNSPYIAKTWEVNPETGVATEILASDAARFITGASGFLTQDEENSGIIEVTELVERARWSERGRRYYLADMQAHYANGTELVEGGQLYLIESARQVRDHDSEHEDDYGHDRD